MSKDNAALLYGGGQNPLGNYTLAEATSYMLQFTSGKLYGVHKSFLGLKNIECYEILKEKHVKIMYNTIGTYLETCREVNTDDIEYLEQVRIIFDSLNIGTLIVCGGDGSCRAVESIIQYTGIKVVFIPSTIDGMNGTDESIGKASAIRESYIDTVCMATNCFAIYNPNFIGSRIAVMELQGRNRDDILVGVLDRAIMQSKIGAYNLEDIKLIAIPSGWKWSFKNLISKVKELELPTLILVSEGAKPIEKNYSLMQGEGIGAKIANAINYDGTREARCHAVGYLSQITDRITTEDKFLVKNWVDKALSHTLFYASSSEATIYEDGKFINIRVNSLIEQNPNSKDVIPFSEENKKKFGKYLV